MRRLTRRAGGGAATLAVGETGRASLDSGHGGGCCVVGELGWRHWEAGTGSTEKEGGRGRRAEWTQRRTRTFGVRGRQILGAEELAIPGLLLVGVLSGSGPRGIGNLG